MRAVAVVFSYITIWCNQKQNQTKGVGHIQAGWLYSINLQNLIDWSLASHVSFRQVRFYFVLILNEFDAIVQTDSCCIFSNLDLIWFSFLNISVGRKAACSNDALYTSSNNNSWKICKQITNEIRWTKKYVWAPKCSKIDLNIDMKYRSIQTVQKLRKNYFSLQRIIYWALLASAKQIFARNPQKNHSRPKPP